MPRPPRAKVASRVAKPQDTQPKAVPSKPAPKTRATRSTRARETAATSTNFSEDSDGLVTKSKATRPSRRTRPDHATPHEETDEFTMAGALAVEEGILEPSISHHTPAPAASKRARLSRGSARRSAGKTTSPAVISAQSPLSNEPLPTGYVSIDESSGFGDLTFSSLGSESPAHGTRPPSAIKVGVTPAHERSILALTNFKRRARQPSLLRMVQQTTDVEDNDHSDLDNTDNFEFEDFLPHAESTPLHVRKNGPSEEVRNDSGTQISSSGSRGTKRKLSSVVQVPRSSPPESPTRNTDSDIESERSPSPSLPDVVPSRDEIIAQTQDDDEILSETYAPPLSSSPIPEKQSRPAAPTQRRPHGRGRSGKTPTYEEDDVSEAEETETPAKAKRGAKKKAQPSLSTTQLTGLLPRRRNRLRDRDEFDLDSEEEVTQFDSDQDELQMPARRNRQRPGARPASPKASKKMARKEKAGSPRTAPRLSRTYSRRNPSDKENDCVEQEDQEATEVSAIEHSEKLAAVRKKFEEVDAFELEFETVDVTTSSSPFR